MRLAKRRNNYWIIYDSTLFAHWLTCLPPPGPPDSSDQTRGRHRIVGLTSMNRQEGRKGHGSRLMRRHYSGRSWPSDESRRVCCRSMVVISHGNGKPERIKLRQVSRNSALAAGIKDQIEVVWLRKKKDKEMNRETDRERETYINNRADRKQQQHIQRGALWEFCETGRAVESKLLRVLV